MIRTKEQLIEEIRILKERLAEFEKPKIRERLSAEFPIQSDAYYRLLAENVSDAIWAMDMNMRFTYFNSYVENMFGYSAKEALGLKLEKLLAPASFELAVKTFKEELAEEEKKSMNLRRSRTLELEHIHKKGKRVWAEVKMAFIRDSEAKPTGILGVSRDITERKQIQDKLQEAYAEMEIRVKVRTAELSKVNEDLHKEIYQCRHIEEALKESEAKFRAIAENSMVGIGILQGDTIAYVNQNCADTFGYNQKELIGMSMFDLISPEDRRIIAELAARRFEGEDVPPTYEFKGMKKDGSKFDVEVSASPPLQIGGSLSLVTVTQDVTKRKQILRELEEKEKFLVAVFSSIQDGISVLDKDMNILRVNATMEKWYKHAMPLVGKKCYKAYHGRRERCKICPTYRTLQTGEEAFEVVPKTGEAGKITGWLDLYSFPLLDPETGELKGVIEYVRDITKLKKLQQKQDKK